MATVTVKDGVSAMQQLLASNQGQGGQGKVTTPTSEMTVADALKSVETGSENGGVAVNGGGKKVREKSVAVSTV